MLTGLLQLQGCGDDDSDGQPGPEQCKVTLLSPNGGERWIVGELVDIAWETNNNCGDYVRISLLKDGDSCFAIADSVQNSGLFGWRVEQCQGDSSGYIIEVVDLMSIAFDRSNTYFRIVYIEPEECELEILEPSGHQEFFVGDTVSIAWDAAGSCSETVVIELLREWVVCAYIDLAAPNTGSYEWAAVQCDEGVVDYRIRITDVENSAQDTSTGSFFILPLLPPECVTTFTDPVM
jgi:hypothetical protein